MKLKTERFTIRLSRPFRIAHGCSTTRETILVHLRDEEEGIESHGEGALPPYYPSTAEASLDWLNQLAPENDLGSWERACLAPGSDEMAAGRVALEIALQDYQAQRAGTPLWQWWGLSPMKIPSCWRTLSIASTENELTELLDEAAARGSGCIKLKTGSGDSAWDERCIELASQRPVRLGLDVNQGWTPAQAAEILRRWRGTVTFAEQPVPREVEQWQELRSRIGETVIPPLIADESLQTERDLPAFQGLADAVNVKLLKAGGLRAARQWIALARELKMGVMIGGMVETGIGRTAAAQLAPLADWADIDPPDSIPAAPMLGFRVAGDRLMLSDRPGLGLWRV